MKIVKISKPQSAHTWAAVYAFHLWLLSAVFVPVSWKDFWTLNCQNICGSIYRAVCCQLSYCPLAVMNSGIPAARISVAVFTKLSAVTLPVVLLVSWLKAARINVVANRALLCMAVDCLRSWTFSCQDIFRSFESLQLSYGLVSFCVISLQEPWNAMLPRLCGMEAGLSGWAFGFFLAEDRDVICLL